MAQSSFPRFPVEACAELPSGEECQLTCLLQLDTVASGCSCNSVHAVFVQTAPDLTLKNSFALFLVHTWHNTTQGLTSTPPAGAVMQNVPFPGHRTGVEDLGREEPKTGQITVLGICWELFLLGLLRLVGLTGIVVATPNCMERICWNQTSTTLGLTSL